ncbi:hypothetical protein E2C01_089809 [Portunus trituberculatus]|uniref:Uncharacterized protein n=1 Tax=Portunus trituberculatus TaxID=210409 RepID=A0A5B7JEM0_PORTR|nr:hypothetical protein [Portunus trituberculatus]
MLMFDDNGLCDHHVKGVSVRIHNCDANLIPFVPGCFTGCPHHTLTTPGSDSHSPPPTSHPDYIRVSALPNQPHFIYPCHIRRCSSLTYLAMQAVLSIAWCFRIL